MPDSESNSVVETSNTTEQFDERIAATDNAIVVRLDDNSQIELTDPGLILAARDAFESFEAVNTAALDFASDTSAQSFALADEVLNQSRSEQARGLEQVLKIGAVVAIAAIAASALPRVVRG